MFFNLQKNDLEPLQEGYKGVIPKPEKEQSDQQKKSTDNQKINKK